MSGLFWLALIVVSAPFCICLAHAAVSRAVRAFGVSVAPQLIVLSVVLIGNIPVAWAAWEWVLRDLARSPGEVICGLCYVLITYNGFGFCYFHVLNASETSLSVHIIMELLVEGEFAPDELERRYSATHMIATRIERMITLGQLKDKDGYFVSSNHTLVIAGKLMNMWRTALGLPVTPE
jgi:hypothetical protein